MHQFLFQQNGYLKVILTINHTRIENAQLVIMLKKAMRQQIYCSHQLKLARSAMVVNSQQQKLRAHALSAIAFTVKT